MYKVLLVDDEILVRDAIRENINWNHLGYELIGDCENGKEAIEFIEQNEVEVVLTDICMPYVDGMELSKYLYENYPDVAIIIFSGFGEFEYAKKAIQYKVAEYILKPVTAMELSKVLESLRERLEEKQKEKLEKNKLKQTYRTYRKNESVILSNVLSQLVMGTQNIEKCLMDIQEFKIDLEASDYRIAVFELDVYSELCQSDEEVKKEKSLMGFVLYNIADELVKKCKAGLVYQDNENRLILLFKTNTPKESVKKLQELCKEIQKQVKENTKLTVSVGIGNYVKSLPELHYSYESALEALGYRYQIGMEAIVDICTDGNRRSTKVNFESVLEALVVAIKGDSPTREGLLDELEERLNQTLLEKNYIYICLEQIMRAIAECAKDVGEPLSIFLERRQELVNEILESNCYQKAFQIVRQYVDEVVTQMEEMKHSSGQRQAILAMDFIRANYADPKLSLNDICSYLCISTSHFSTIFKEATGETFMEVLIRTRMEKAKELLERTNLKNYEIAEKVGFSDPHYFSLSFKKMTGKTPTKYARENR